MTGTQTKSTALAKRHGSSLQKSVIELQCFALVAEQEAPGPEAHYVFHAMASGSVLDGLRYSRFLADEDAATGVTASTTEGRYGIPRYNGDPSRLNEWIFRAKTLERKEAALTDEQKKLGPLTLRLIECFSGQALKIAQGLDMAKLEKPDTGLTYLIDSLSGELRPRRLQQARELYEAGAQTGGIMARNPMESMGQYVLRRRAWYRALVDLNAELKLPDLILSEQLLNNAGLTHDQKAYDTNGDWSTRTYMNERYNIQATTDDLSETNEEPLPGYRGGQGKGPNHYKSGYHGKPRFRAFLAENDVQEYVEEPDYEDHGNVEEEPHGYYGQEEDPLEPYEIGTFAEEHLAFLAENGLDLEDPEACEYAAEMVQSQEEAYFAGKQARTKGHSGFRGPQFELSGSFSLDEKKAKLQALKARTTCKRCGAVGHWSGDAICPLQKGKGPKGKTSTSTTSTTSPPSSGKGKPTKPRTVYFSISEDIQPDPFASLALRRDPPPEMMALPPSYRAVPPPTTLQSPPMDPESPGHWSLVATDDYQEERHWENPMWNYNRTNSTRRSDNVTYYNTSRFHDFTYYNNTSAKDNESNLYGIHGEGEYRHSDGTTRTGTGTVSGVHSQECYRRWIQCSLPPDQVQGLWHAVDANEKGTGDASRYDHSLYNRSMPAPLGDVERVEWSNAYSHMFDVRLPSTYATTPLTREQVLRTMDTFVQLIQQRTSDMGSTVPSSRLHEELELAVAANITWSEPRSTATPSYGYAEATPVETGGGRWTTSTPPRMPTSGTAANSHTPDSHQGHLRARGQKIVEAGRYKHSVYDVAYQDENYRNWVIQNIGDNSHSSMKALKQYFLERNGFHREHPHLALMAFGAESSEGFPEGDLVAILDTGCNQTCHGSRWLERYMNSTGQDMPNLDENDLGSFRGINGRVRTNGTRHIHLCLELVNGGLAQGDLHSTELCDSDAPLLLSVQAQKALGLIIDVAGEVVHSQALGQDLKLVYKDGLLAIRLLPGDLAGTLDEHPDEGRDEPPSGGPDSSPTTTMPATTTASPDWEIVEQEDQRDNGDIGYFAVDAEQPHVMNRQQHARVKEGTAAVRARDRHLWSQVRPFRHRRTAELPRGCRTFLLEIFAGAAILTQVAYQDWGLPVSNPVDLNTGFDLLTREGHEAVDYIIEKDDPYAIAFAPVCTPWTSWTNVLTGEARNRVMMTRKKWQPVIKWMYDIAEKRLQRGRHVLIENPWNSAMWDTKQSQTMFNKQLCDSATMEPLECVKVDQCSVGLCDTVNGLPHLKPTGFLTASYHVKTEPAYCKCPGDHQHQQLDTKLRCQRAQQWPKQLCELIIGGWVRELEYCYSMTAFPAEAEQEIGDTDDEDTEGRLDAIHDPGDFVTGISAPDITLPDYAEKKEQEQLEILQEEEPHPPPPAPEGQAMLNRQRLWKQLPYTTRVALRRLHNMTGHSPPAAMQRLLRTAGADPDAIRGLDNFRCQVCEEKKQPQRPAAVKMPEEYRFNKAISLDVFIIKDAIGRRYKVMSIVDLGTLFHVAVIVGEGAGPPGSGDMAHALSTCWLNWAGIPDSIVLDRGLENRGKLQQLVKAHGILLRYIGVESAYQLGRGERQGGILKEVIKATVLSRQLRGRQNMEFVVTEAVSIKNHRINHNGFSPAQWVLGRNPPEIDALTNLDSQPRLGIHQEILDGESAFAQQMMIRGAARESFAPVDSSHRVRSSLLRLDFPWRPQHQPRHNHDHWLLRCCHLPRRRCYKTTRS
ncbi:TY4B-J [Symbiodinium sp. KB8]|nr:TY4B-J [Symbiodinium sp. KB8]